LRGLGGGLSISGDAVRLWAAHPYPYPYPLSPIPYPDGGSLACSTEQLQPRENSTTQEVVDRQLRAYKALAEAVEGNGGRSGDVSAGGVRAAVLQQHGARPRSAFVHRVRMSPARTATRSTSSSCSPPRLIDNDGVLEGNNVIKFVPDQSVLKLDVGDRIALSAAQFERLYKAFLKEIRAKFS